MKSRGVKVLEGQDKRSRGKTKSKGARQKVKGQDKKQRGKNYRVNTKDVGAKQKVIGFDKRWSHRQKVEESDKKGNGLEKY